MSSVTLGPSSIPVALHIQYFRPYLLLIYHYTLSIPSYGNMEVLTSMNRMSATTFLSLYFASKYGTGLHF